MIASNIRRDGSWNLLFSGRSVAELAEKYGTPLYLMDEDRIRENCRMYLDAFRESFPVGSIPLYASKAACFRQMVRIAAEEGMALDVVSAGEIYTALSAGFPAERIYFHGDAKTDDEIRYALKSGIGYFIVDNPTELFLLQKMAEEAGIRQKVLLRITPGIDPHTYEAVNTGRVDVKFGVPLETGQGFQFVKDALAMKALEVAGLHCHVGSMVFDEMVFEDTVDVMIRFMKELAEKLGYITPILNLGGGYGVRYVESDGTVDIPARIRALAAHIRMRTEEARLPMPQILMEPGRSIVADAGMTVYTVCNVKRIPGFKNYVIVDGGMSDNPRYCLYQAQYTVLSVSEGTGQNETYDLAGRCCESGDIIQPAVLLPAEISRGDLVAVCTTGAYNYSMASNYNRLGRPPVVMLREGKDYLAVKRETPSDLCALDL